MKCMKDIIFYTRAKTDLILLHVRKKCPTILELKLRENHETNPRALKLWKDSENSEIMEEIRGH